MPSHKIFLKIKEYLKRLIGSRKSKYVDAQIISEVYKVVIACPQCRQKLRLPVYEDKRLHVTCSKCKKEFAFDCKKYRSKQRYIFWSIAAICLIVFAIDIIVPIVLISKRHTFAVNIKSKYELQFKKMQDAFEKGKGNLKENYDNEIKKIDIAELKTKATEHYEKIWEERKKYSSKYAITPREKAQLEMLALSKDKTKSIEDIIKGIAVKAAPRNSTINVLSSGAGYNLDIDFDMSELSSGEEGTRTKHHFVDSLKKDVIRLISKVTNDVYQFCQNLDLESISIGCRHYVNQYDEYKIYRGEANTVLYKIRLDKKDLRELKDNPFLDTYSTTKYFKVEEDDFPNLEIKESKS